MKSNPEPKSPCIDCITLSICRSRYRKSGVSFDMMLQGCSILSSYIKETLKGNPRDIQLELNASSFLFSGK